MTKVKICGMMRPEDVAMAAEADFLGFVVGSDSRRNLTMAAARELMSMSTKTNVMVSSCPKAPKLIEMALQLDANVVQVHSQIPANDLKAIKKTTGCEVWALVPVGGGDEDRASEIAASADAVVMDTAGGAPGGSGRVHDWSVSALLCRLLDGRAVLAGGLTPTNVAEAVREVRPLAVDVSSGVERFGRKDPRLVKDFIAAARSVEQ